MTRWFMLFVVVCTDVGNTALGDEFKFDQWKSDGPGYTTIQSFKDRPQEIFRMWPGACLVGPMAFYDFDHLEIFKLDDGVEYPSGCNKKPVN
jgi:hypothetical protein